MIRGIRTSRPSPALVVAILALVAGVTGAAVANPSAKKVTTKKVKKIANKQIDKRAPGLDVASAEALANVTYVTTTAPVPAGGPADTFVSAQCPEGLTAIGGGIKMSPPFTIGVESSHPTSSGWAGAVYSSVATTATTTAICAKARTTTGAPPAS